LIEEGLIGSCFWFGEPARIMGYFGDKNVFFQKNIYINLKNYQNNLTT
jgi:hypothetical protein